MRVWVSEDESCLNRRSPPLLYPTSLSPSGHTHIGKRIAEKKTGQCFLSFLFETETVFWSFSSIQSCMYLTEEMDVNEIGSSLRLSFEKKQPNRPVGEQVIILHIGSSIVPASTVNHEIITRLEYGETGFDIFNSLVNVNGSSIQM